MKKITSIKDSLFEKALNQKSLLTVNGGVTLTGCRWSAEVNSSDCTDTDADAPAETIAPL